MNSFKYSQVQQQGSVLVISMMILIAVTLVTFTSSRSALLQENLTANHRDDVVALQVAMAGMEDAKELLSALPPVDNSAFPFKDQGKNAQGMYDGRNCTFNDAYCYMNALNDLFDENYWSNANAYTEDATGIPCNNGVSNCRLKGKYAIVFLGNADELFIGGGAKPTLVTTDYANPKPQGGKGSFIGLFKVISYGAGLNPNNVKVISNYFAVSFGGAAASGTAP